VAIIVVKHLELFESLRSIKGQGRGVKPKPLQSLCLVCDPGQVYLKYNNARLHQYRCQSFQKIS